MGVDRGRGGKSDKGGQGEQRDKLSETSHDA
jgi:hypothetical protein